MKLAATAACFAGLLAATAAGQTQRSLTDSGLGSPALRSPAERYFAEPEENPAALEESILLLRASIKELSESLAIANTEAELFKRQAADLSMRLEALGLAGVEGDPARLEQRLITAMRELRRLQDQNEEARMGLVSLTEAVLALVHSARDVDPGLRSAVEAELRRTTEILGTPPGIEEAPAVEATLTDGRVMEVKNELSLIVANIGERQGVRIGMPFQVVRDGTLVGSVMAVDVRERISGAIIQNLESEDNPIRTGDRLLVETRR